MAANALVQSPKSKVQSPKSKADGPAQHDKVEDKVLGSRARKEAGIFAKELRRA